MFRAGAPGACARAAGPKSLMAYATNIYDTILSIKAVEWFIRWFDNCCGSDVKGAKATISANRPPLCSYRELSRILRAISSDNNRTAPQRLVLLDLAAPLTGRIKASIMIGPNPYFFFSHVSPLALLFVINSDRGCDWFTVSSAQYCPYVAAYHCYANRLLFA